MVSPSVVEGHLTGIDKGVSRCRRGGEGLWGSPLSGYGRGDTENCCTGSWWVLLRGTPVFPAGGDGFGTPSGWLTSGYDVYRRGSGWNTCVVTFTAMLWVRKGCGTKRFRFRRWLLFFCLGD